MPALEITGEGANADLGLSIDGNAWLELHVPREQVLQLDYEALAKSCSQLEIYGAQDYLTDF